MTVLDTRRKVLYTLIVSAAVVYGIAIPMSIAQARCQNAVGSTIAQNVVNRFAAKLFPVASACGGSVYIPPQTYTLTVSPVVNGTVTGSGINCPGTCAVTFNINTNVVLTATPAAGYSFAGWGGNCSGTGTCSLTMNAAKNVTATFTQNSEQPLTIITNGPGTISVTSTLTCIDDCVITEPTGLAMTLTANVLSGYNFGGWSGDCVSATIYCNLVINGPKTVTASFRPILTTSAVNGTITSSPAGINCGATCAAAFDFNSTVTLTATPAAGYYFAGWGGDCSALQPCTPTMNSAINVTAYFNPTRQFSIHIVGLGTVSFATNLCANDCTYSLPGSSDAYLVAQPNDGHAFLGWFDENGVSLQECPTTSLECHTYADSIYAHFTDRF